jgi:signal transduction histidine kinase/ActR/RegA family two-component response regulator
VYYYVSSALTEFFKMDSKEPRILDFLSGGGEMSRRIAAYDWRQSPLGDIAFWPQSLRTALSVVLNSKFPTYMAWGPSLIGFHNDAYEPVLGEKEALAIPFQQTWSEAWHVVGPIAEQAMAGEASFFENMPIVLERHGYPEQTFYTFSYSPIRNEAGQVGGILCTVVETTTGVLAQQRQQFQLELCDGLRGLTEPEEITGFASRLLGQYTKALRVGYSDVDDVASLLQVRPGWNDGTQDNPVGVSLPLTSFGPKVVADLRDGHTVRLEDVRTDSRSVDYVAAYSGLGVRAMLVVPLVRGGKLIAVVSISSREPRRWTDDEAALVEDTAERTRASVERAVAENALKQQLAQERDRLHLLFDQAPSFMAVLRGPNHVFELTNSAYQSMVGDRNQIGKPVREALPEAEGQGFFELLDAAYASGKPFSAQDAPLLVQQAPGQALVQLYLDFVYQPVIEADGKVSGIFVEGFDVTERKLANDALREADRRKDEFLAMLAHELRNPLAPISAAADLLRIGSHDEMRVKRASEVISRQARHMAGLLDDLLDVSRVTRGLAKLEQIPLDANRIASDAIEQVRSLMSAKRHHLIVHTPPESAFVIGDLKRLVQVLTNVLTNAAKFTPDGGNISLTIEVQENRVMLVVEDNGFGMTPELMERAFDLFAQGERTADRTQGGLGIGLALVKSLVHMHSGQVLAYSNGLGEGSKFTIVLPRTMEQAGELETDYNDSAQAEAVRPLKIMVVDDNVDAAEMLAMFIEALGHQVVVEHSANRALERAKIELPEVCLLDIGLPEMDGNELARRLRVEPGTNSSVLVAVTGYGQEQDRNQTRAAGFNYHFVKPLDMEKLTSLLKQIGESHSGK